jgi:hypothetical protein
VFHNLARQKESEIEEGHWLLDHVPMLIAIPPCGIAGDRVHQRQKCECSRSFPRREPRLNLF